MWFFQIYAKLAIFCKVMKTHTNKKKLQNVIFLSRLSVKIVEYWNYNYNLDDLCTNMCIHFESLLGYAQSRDFWRRQRNNQSTTKTTSRQRWQPPSTSTRSETSKSNKSKENDSGHFTLDDDYDITSKQST